MILTKSASIDHQSIQELCDAIITFILNLNGSLSNEQYYGAYILRQIYSKLLVKENNLIKSRKRHTTLKLDSVQSMVLIEVLKGYPASISLNILLMELGKIVPSTRRDIDSK